MSALQQRVSKLESVTAIDLPKCIWVISGKVPEGGVTTAKDQRGRAWDRLPGESEDEFSQRVGDCLDYSNGRPIVLAS